MILAVYRECTYIDILYTLFYLFVVELRSVNVTRENEGIRETGKFMKP